MDHGDVVLRDSDGKTWSAEYRTILGCNERPYVKLCNGWGAFVRDNNIQVGDVCIFELIDCIDISFQVFICGGNHRSVAKLDDGISSTHQKCLGPLKAHEALELPSEVSPEFDDNQLGTSRPQTGEDDFRSEKKECNAYPESSTLLFSMNKTMFEKGEPTEISLDVFSSRCEHPLAGSKPPVIPLSSLPPSSSPSRFSRLQNTTSATYSEAALAKKDELLENVELKVSKSEVYTEEHEKLLGDTQRSWTHFVDGYGSDGRQIYDVFEGKNCHQCRQRMLGHCTRCSKCYMGRRQFCGDCLYMRYGEHILEANENPNWVCPVCRGICNCSMCRKAKGWAPTGSLYKKVKKMGFKSVAHYLIQTQRAQTNMEKVPDDTDQVSPKRSLSCLAQELPSEESPEVDDNQLVTSKPHTGEDGFNSENKEYNAYPESSTLLLSKNETVFEKVEPTETNLDVHEQPGFPELNSGGKIDVGKELDFSNTEPGGSPVTLESIPEKDKSHE
ncbi:cell division cycle-associated protein 7-like [Hibiscus syriacus]|uniref:cell division cycle-associated protein 7-like n=1 Tax=Hibiscus syriacus TaxID=106335 RepID=UPI001924AFAF|nr:cell division cycle-associated protein 7-like [Hibiscus syriacus]